MADGEIKKQSRHGMIAEDKVRISLVIPKDLKEKLTAMAEREDRSFNSLVIRILTNYHKKNKVKE